MYILHKTYKQKQHNFYLISSYSQLNKINSTQKSKKQLTKNNMFKNIYRMSELIINTKIKMSSKQSYKIGQMIIDQKQIFWKMQHCYALIPIIQLLDGHVLLTTNRPVQNYSSLQPVQIFDLSLTINFISKSLQSFHSCTSTNIHIQNSTQQSPCKQMIIHIIPRKVGDLKNNDLLYEQFQTYPADLVKQYNQKMNFYVNAYANKILEGIHEQAKKYQAHLNLCYKEEKQT